MVLIKILRIKKIIDSLLELVSKDYNDLKTSYKNLQITSEALNDGNLTLTVGVSQYIISVLATDSISNIITKILAQTYIGYTATINDTDSVDFATTGTAILSINNLITGVDYLVSDREEDTFLYRLLNGNVDGDYNFYEQSKNIFLRDDLSSRKISTSLMFNKNKNEAPHIHIREAIRSKGNSNGIGGVIGGYHEMLDDSISDVYRDVKKGGYEVLVTSSNALETVLIGEVIYSLLIGAWETLADQFITFDMSVKELVFQYDSATPLYAKSISLDVQQENFIPSIMTEEFLNKISFNLESLD